MKFSYFTVTFCLLCVPFSSFAEEEYKTLPDGKILATHSWVVEKDQGGLHPISAMCQPGKRLLIGGCSTTGPGHFPAKGVLKASYPFLDDDDPFIGVEGNPLAIDSWQCSFANTAVGDKVTAFAYCQ